MIIHTGCSNFVKLCHRRVYQPSKPLHACCCLSLHVVARRSVFLSCVTIDFVDRDSRIAHGDLCDRFTFGSRIALRTAQVNLINGGVDTTSHFSSGVQRQCPFFLSYLYVINADRQKQLTFSLKVKTFPSWHSFPSFLQWNTFIHLSFPK